MENNPVFGLVLQNDNPQQPPMADLMDRQADKNKPTSVHVNIQDKKSSGKSCIAVVAILAILVLAVAVAGIIVLVFFNPSTNNQSKEQIESLKLEIEKMRELLNQAGNSSSQRLDINDLQEIMVQTSSFRTLEFQLNNSNEKIQAQQSQLNSSKVLWSQLNQAFQLEIVSLRELQNRTELKSNKKIQALQLQLNTSTQEIQTLQLELINTRNNSNQEIQSLQSRLNISERVIQTLQSQLNTSNQEIQSLQSQIERLNELPDQINNSNQEIDKLRETLNLTGIDTSQDIQSLQVEVDGLLNKTERGVTCPNVLPPQNGQLSFVSGANMMSLGLGSVATYSCDTGYALVGQTARVCEDRNGGTVTTGTWSGTTPTCQMILCLELPAPDNGTVIVNTGSNSPQIGVGTIATYSCDTGYVLVGQTTRDCEDRNGGTTGEWSGSPPTCEVIVTCQPLTHPNNGVITVSTGTYGVTFGLGAVATYSCNTGFGLVGQTTRDCEDTNGGTIGTWGGSSPRCEEVVTCQSLTEPNNGAITFTSGSNNVNIGLGSVATYSCDVGYVIVGQTTRVCQNINGGSIGDWSGSSPACSEVVTCQPLTQPDNGTVTISSGINYLSVGSVATYSCDTGYALVGQTTLVCEDRYGGTWSGSPPTCEVILCLELSAPDNGTVIINNSPQIGVGTIATYSCDTGYVIVGQTTRGCEDRNGGTTGEWSGSSPTCGIPNNAVIDCQQTACRNEQLICPEHNNCTVNCDDSRSYACYQTAVACSDGGDCVVNCDDSYACLGATTTCPEGGNCVTNCNSAHACTQATTECSGGNCVMNCDNDYSCRNLTVTGSPDGYSITNCRDNYACRYANITCPEGGNCTIVCDDYFSCRDSTITCLENSNFTINCTSSYACYHATITCPRDSGDCNLNCGGRFSCERANIACPGGKECVNCNGQYSCQHTTFTCPVNQSCSVACTGFTSCQYANFRCTDSENCTINCNGEQSCPLATITCPENHDCTINCNGIRGCANTRVTCPTGDYNCNINCTDPFSCENLRITNTANVNLQCCGGVSCAGTNVIPTSRPECVFT